jgi:hypothetical protein
VFHCPRRGISGETREAGTWVALEIESKRELRMIAPTPRPMRWERRTTNELQRSLKMNSKFRKIGGLSSAVILTVVMAGCATHAELGADTGAGDAQVSSNVRALFDQHPELGSPNSIEVQTVDHVVYLNGTVSQGLQSEEAQTVALQAAGVTRVVNTIGVSR